MENSTSFYKVQNLLPQGMEILLESLTNRQNIAPHDETICSILFFSWKYHSLSIVESCHWRLYNVLCILLFLFIFFKIEKDTEMYQEVNKPSYIIHIPIPRIHHQWYLNIFVVSIFFSEKSFNYFFTRSHAQCKELKTLFVKKWKYSKMFQNTQNPHAEITRIDIRGTSFQTSFKAYIWMDEWMTNDIFMNIESLQILFFKLLNLISIKYNKRMKLKTVMNF